MAARAGDAFPARSRIGPRRISLFSMSTSPFRGTAGGRLRSYLSMRRDSIRRSAELTFVNAAARDIRYRGISQRCGPEYAEIEG